ncbi:MAG: glucosamine--fructose-6-phosphate aminotransferase [Syntrophus sp. PtaU1.Bin005]|jgi:glutamate synthase domain-containing protein 1/glutamate synthase domain-containing protein 3|nr:MAG: glucosamine--fructose-6-phosphate aminotransferase [Syntrophus sp. PtaU1.Bin005]
MDSADKILLSRTELCSRVPDLPSNTEEEGGCGVTGFISSIPVTGKNIFEPSVQMHNRGNGKGGGIGAVGFIPEALGVSRQVLDEDYMLHIALLETDVAEEIEQTYIQPYFRIDKSGKLATIDDYRSIGLEVRPPDIMRYFVRVRDDVLDQFIREHDFSSLDRRDAEDEFVYQNSFRINTRYYASLGEKKAFVMSHGRNMMILKIVGYAENVVRYYKLDDFKAHVWLAHQRYPTRGRVWHPGGCHPFSALNEALVHNGDFANYQAIYEYLKQRNYTPLFLTDTEEAALLLDLWSRVYKYPLEYLIEAMAPTSEMDFDMLPAEKQELYKAISTHHVNASPDGPWFFIIARNDVRNSRFQLIGITDTAMLRPQVFALQEGEVSIGLICSEKQAIDATLISLEREDPRFGPIADKYWNARGGSYTDGGSFIFSLQDAGDGSENRKLICTDKFGKVIETPKDKLICDLSKPVAVTESCKEIEQKLAGLFSEKEPTDAAQKMFTYIRSQIVNFEPGDFRFAIETIKRYALEKDEFKQMAIEALTLLYDRRYDTGRIKRSSVQHVLKVNLDEIFSMTPLISEESESAFRRIDFTTRDQLRAPRKNERTLIVDAERFEPEGDLCDAVLIVAAYKLGWKRFIVYRYRGQRFTGCGFGPVVKDVRIDVYDSSGDYLASGIDGLEIHVHGNAQDQLCQIMKDGKLVVYGDVGQTFMYGAKGGSAYIMGNAAGRPLINAVGKPRVVINGTALDYLAESFMAGDPLNGGGFVILNGIGFDDNDGSIREYESPYPGSNIFSLASGGAIYVRDPRKRLVNEQLNGGQFASVTEADWNLILPYLEENERLFGISVDRLLTVDGQKRPPAGVYRKIIPQAAGAPAKNDDGLSEWESGQGAMPCGAAS